MIVDCLKCRMRFEDEYRSTVCPHAAFPANDGHNNFKVHDDAYLWPLVTQEEINRRPGKGPICFYCEAALDQPHDVSCVMVDKVVEYIVEDADGKRLGIFTRPDPWFWNEEDCDFHKNESSWCQSNGFDAIVWDDSNEARSMQDALNNLTDDQCGCGIITYQFNRVVDNTPTRSEG